MLRKLRPEGHLLQRITFALAAFLALAAAPAAAPAAAAEVRPDMACYLSGQRVLLAGSGWTAGAQWQVSGGVQTFAAGVVDASGEVAADGWAPVLTPSRRGVEKLPLAATDGVSSAAATVRVVNGGAIWNSTGQPRRSVRWSFGGLAPGEPIYVHVRRGGRTVKTTHVGTGSGPCGVKDKRLPRLPVPPARVRNGEYRIYVDNRKRFAPAGEGRIQYRYTYRVKTRIRLR